MSARTAFIAEAVIYSVLSCILTLLFGIQLYWLRGRQLYNTARTKYWLHRFGFAGCLSILASAPDPSCGLGLYPAILPRILWSVATGLLITCYSVWIHYVLSQLYSQVRMQMPEFQPILLALCCVIC